MALKDAPLVKVLKFNEKEAYNPDRPISGLIRTQLLHLHHAENISVPPEARTNININDLLTERQASEYIRKVTLLLHQYGQASEPLRQKQKKSGAAKGKKKLPGKKKPIPAKKTKSKPKSR